MKHLGLTGHERLLAQIHQTPLLERLDAARSMIGKMCSQGRPPKMSIPVQYNDEDVFISITLQDAIEVLTQVASASGGTG